MENPGQPWHFNPSIDADFNEVFRIHLERFWEERLPEATGNQFNGMANCAAGLLSYGRLEMVDYILDNLPPEKIEMVQGYGYCNLLAFQITIALLPLPEQFRDCFQWAKGTQEENRLKEWFRQNRTDLVWNSTSGVFELKPRLSQTND
jgi:hypothetical protein